MTLTVQGSRIGVASAARDWWDIQWPLTTGCTKASEGCKNCAAATLFARVSSFQRFAQLDGPPPGDPHRANWTGHVETFPERLFDAATWDASRRVFVDASSDLFHSKVPDTFLDSAFEAMARSAATFGVLTKRSDRMRGYLRGKIVPGNIWIGVTVESMAYESRISDLLDIDAQVRWVSAEPLLGELSLSQWLGPHKINWIVAGPELGEHARPCKFEWIQRLLEECRIAGVPYFTKHLLSGRKIREYPDGST